MIHSPQRRALLETLLVAHKDGRIDELLAQRPRRARSMAQRWLCVVWETAGDRLPEGHRAAAALTLLLRWALTQLRPDQALTLAGIERSVWLDRTSWRPVLALMCHYGFAPIPTYRDRYHPRPQESAADTLCGLWAVGPSTFYRYLDKGERQLADVLATPPTGAKATSLRRFVTQFLADGNAWVDAQARCEWHRHQAQALAPGTTPRAPSVPTGVLWHQLQAGDAKAFAQTVLRAHVALANDAETDGLCALMAAHEGLDARERFDLCLAQAALWRVRQAPERESQCYEQALRLASAEGDALMLGTVYGAMGKFYEPRDRDRAHACYEDSAEFLREAAPQAPADEVARQYTSTLVRLGWLYVLRNDPRSRTVLDTAQQLRSQREVPADVRAMLEQTWGEYWRRAGDLPRALEHKHRALNLYERLGDQRSVLVTYVNLSPIYGQLKDFERAIDYAQRVLTASERVVLESEMLCSVQLNLGAIYFWQDRYDLAIQQYQSALERGRAAGLALHISRAHYNLAEAFYKRFQAAQDPADERQGDAHALAARTAGGDAEMNEAARTLKTNVLGRAEGANPDRLLPHEFAVHFDEMTEVQRHRAVLAVPVEPTAHVRAHLAIARAYLAIAAKEREAAIALIDKHRLGAQFDADFEDLRRTFQRALTREEQAAALWARGAADLLREDDRRAALLAELFHHGAVSKSVYAHVTGVALATASKHLVTLAERGLLRQTGKGPSTRYVLPQASDELNP